MFTITIKLMLADSSNFHPTIQDVARRAGVSGMTVSRVMKNHPNVAPDTRERVQRAIDETGYRSNPLLTALVQQRQRKSGQDRGLVLAYVVDSNYTIGVSGFPSDLFEGARDEALKHGFKLEVFQSERRKSESARLDSIIHARGIPGLIIGPVPLDLLYRGFEFQWDRYAAIVLDYGFEGPHFDRVLADHYTATRMALSECARRGLQRIGLLMGRVFHERVGHRTLAIYWGEYHDSAVHAGLPPLILDTWNEADFARWFDAEAPEVIVTTWIFLPQLTAFLHSRGVRVPDDLGIINLNTRPEPKDTALGSLVFSGTDAGAREMGKAASQNLIACLYRNERGVPSSGSETVIRPHWLAGETLRNV